MRIIHVVTRLGLGGAERVAETLAIGHAARGDDVHLVCVAATRDPEIADHMRRNLATHGVDVIDRARASSAKVAIAEGALWLARSTGRLRPDVIHLHTEIPEAAWAAASLISPRVRRTPVVRTIHNTRLWGGWGRLGRLAEARLAGAWTAAVSQAARDALIDWRAASGVASASDPIVIDNGVDLNDLADGPREPDGPPLLCFAGRFEAQKGIDVLIDALDLLPAAGPPFRVAIHGAGGFQSLVAASATRWPDRVTVGPPIPDVRSRLGSFDAVLMPSRFEGMPLLAIEAMCTGVPVLATKAPGLAEVVPAGYPGMCPPGDPSAFAAMIDGYVRDPGSWRAHALRARPEARARFALERMIGSYAELYAAALSVAR
ncbi:MAG: glycosyltransferase family 4 protein [Candidatus Limnocylindrales bacterium]